MLVQGCAVNLAIVSPLSRGQFLQDVACFLSHHLEIHKSEELWLITKMADP